MDFLKDRRILLAVIGAGVALLAGLILAFILVARGKDDKATQPPASQGGLVVEAGGTDDGKLDPARPLRCFVAGQVVGEMTLSECARRNGVATGALDVGVDETGALAAADQAGLSITPLPPSDLATPPIEANISAAGAPNGAATPGSMAGIAPTGPCWRYSGSEWRKLPADMTLNACTQALFSGRCERAGAATYGRWMQQTLRLVPGKVEVSGDNRSFRPLVDQGPGCAIPPVG